MKLRSSFWITKYIKWKLIFSKIFKKHKTHGILCFMEIWKMTICRRGDRNLNVLRINIGIYNSFSIIMMYKLWIILKRRKVRYFSLDNHHIFIHCNIILVVWSLFFVPSISILLYFWLRYPWASLRSVFDTVRIIIKSTFCIFLVGWD